jgi:hypothetical protein
MTPNEMDEFLDLLDRYGGRLEDWPAEARAKAEAWQQASTVAAQQIAAVRRMEAALAASRLDMPVDAFGLAARAMQQRQHTARKLLARRISWGVAGALALVAGFYVGSLPSLDAAPSDIVAAALDQSGGHDVW